MSENAKLLYFLLDNYAVEHICAGELTLFNLLISLRIVNIDLYGMRFRILVLILQFRNEQIYKNMTETNTKRNFPLGKLNMILMAVCLLLIVVGFCLMTGSANEGETFNNAIFESRRTTVGPMIALLGFVLMAPAILWRPKSSSKNDEANDDSTVAAKK